MNPWFSPRISPMACCCSTLTRGWRVEATQERCGTLKKVRCKAPAVALFVNSWVTWWSIGKRSAVALMLCLFVSLRFVLWLVVHFWPHGSRWANDFNRDLPWTMDQALLVCSKRKGYYTSPDTRIHHVGWSTSIIHVNPCDFPVLPLRFGPAEVFPMQQRPSMISVGDLLNPWLHGRRCEVLVPSGAIACRLGGGRLWCFIPYHSTVDGWNPKQPPGMYETL